MITLFLRSLSAIVFLSVSLVATAPAAHFLLNLNVRIFHVEHSDEGIRVLMRMPMPYLIADKLGPEGPDGLPTPAPFTANSLENGELVHYVDLDAIQTDATGLGEIAESGLHVMIDEEQLVGQVSAIRLYKVGSELPFATLSEAMTAFEASQAWPSPPLYVGNTVVDILLTYDAGGPVASYSLSSSLDPGLPDQETTANLILDYAETDPRIFRSRGLMQDPLIISRSPISGLATFVREGIRHILEGLDHVLFVLCMVIGAATLRALVARITGFTVGHTVTLVMGFFGFAPSASWFIPAVETAIALSIIYAAADAVFQKPRVHRSNSGAVAVTGAIGLLHGFGFSFMLREILRVDADNVWQSLLAFNIGVEIGQFAIALVVWPMVILLRCLPGKTWEVARGLIASAVSVVAVFWVTERISGVLL